MKINSNFINLSLYNAIFLAYPFFYVIVIINFDSLDSWGRISYWLALCQILIIFSELGLHVSGPRFIGKNPEHDAVATVWAMLFIKIVLLVVTLPMVFLYFATYKLEYVNYFLILIFYIFGSSLNLISIASKFKISKPYMLIELSSKMVSAACIYFNAYFSGPEKNYIIFISASSFIVTGLMIVVFYKKFGFKIKLNIIQKLCLESVSFFKVHSIGSLMSALPLIVFGTVATDHATGIYSVIDRVSRGLAALVNPLKHYYSVDFFLNSSNKKYYTKVRNQFLIFGLFLSFVQMVLGIVLNYIFVSSNFSLAAPFLIVSAALPALIVLETFFIVFSRSKIGGDVSSTKYMILGILALLLVSYLLNYTIFGMVFAVTTCYTVVILCIILGNYSND